MKFLGRLRLPLDPRVSRIAFGGLLGLTSALAYAPATESVPAAGVYAASLAKRGVHLEAGRRDEWSVALEVNPEAYSQEPVAKTIFATTPARAGRAAGGRGLRARRRYARLKRSAIG